jgi:hypothetical protein
MSQNALWRWWCSDEDDDDDDDDVDDVDDVDEHEGHGTWNASRITTRVSVIVGSFPLAGGQISLRRSRASLDFQEGQDPPGVDWRGRLGETAKNAVSIWRNTCAAGIDGGGPAIVPRALRPILAVNLILDVMIELILSSPKNQFSFKFKFKFLGVTLGECYTVTSHVTSSCTSYEYSKLR